MAEKKAPEPFDGFREEASSFFWELAFHNERPWFLAHKEEFQTLIQRPFRALAEETQAILEQRQTGQEWMLHVSRIYRDARRLHGRGPYKDHLWFTLNRRAEAESGPSFWFEIGGAGYGYGMGYYTVTAAQMERFRTAAGADPGELETLVKRFGEQDRFSLDGEAYKRARVHVSEALDPWLNRRWIGLSRHKDFGGELLTPELPQILAEDFMWLMPYYEYFSGFYDPDAERRAMLRK